MARRPATQRPVAQQPAAFEPRGFLYNGKYYAKYHGAGGINVNNRAAVEDRLIRATMSYLVAEEPKVDDFGVVDVRVRTVHQQRDADLLKVDPGALYVASVVGVDGTGKRRAIPSVMNRDGAVFVDPRLKGGR